MIYLLPIIIIGIFSFVWFRKNTMPSWNTPIEPFPNEWRIILHKEVTFYNSLSDEEQKKFEYKIQEFLLNCRITGIETTVDTTDKLLIASSAIIPIFAFDNWRYSNLKEVLLYPTSFNKQFETSGEERLILGMVGTGYMEGKMILSQQALKHGFKNETDKKNTAIHEFVHLIDKADGVIDGIPSLLLEKQYTIPWLDLINKSIDEIYNGKSDINPYGGTNRAEFFSVISEYFFERPKLLERKHPELYALLERIFKQDMTARKLKKVTISRNSPCPCNSGEKFKDCCGKVHYKKKH
ncbi:zinc-dependent peptidase [Chondrinema litorale]|uniref:zinc-dependent peptidase n=1 Tax=Chondrinema litorale TaxID=2994555 RepID=UPI002542B760|nr:zinc-dependent peptidase [Chondrinema litorale]UZR96509.1 zinc-dependent peptidase [Chondrinema litorale]